MERVKECLVSLTAFWAKKEKVDLIKRFNFKIIAKQVEVPKIWNKDFLTTQKQTLGICWNFSLENKEPRFQLQGIEEIK